ncbi:hypothetical protein NDU88_010911 [Pleurodeles waltl]|uniref:Uncharacterized protein n=1 Tax=Pleurodeles waltl TaxID=8319 RepID=A0AAV7Q0A1_PLEWA|nr:hypothetical protein NDU88_010911 [Pleurodeles waltl]
MGHHIDALESVEGGPSRINLRFPIQSSHSNFTKTPKTSQQELSRDLFTAGATSKGRLIDQLTLTTCLHSEGSNHKKDGQNHTTNEIFEFHLDIFGYQFFSLPSTVCIGRRLSLRNSI